MLERKQNFLVASNKKAPFFYTAILVILFFSIIWYLGSAFHEAIIPPSKNDNSHRKICRMINDKNYLEICFTLKVEDFSDKKASNDNKQKNVQKNTRSDAYNAYEALNSSSIGSLISLFDSQSFNYQQFFSVCNIILIFILYFLFIALKRRVVNIINTIEKDI